MERGKNKSIKYKIISYFLLFSILPVTIAVIYLNIRFESHIKNNVNELIENNIYKTRQCLELSLSTYDTLLYNICSDDDVIKIMKDINDKNEDSDISYSRLRRKLNRTCNAYDYVQGITIISRNGDTAYYDKLSSSSERSSWIDFNKNTIPDLKNTDDNYYLLNESAVKIGNERYNMFSIAHKLIDYNDINEDIGTVIISIDTSVLKDACINQTSQDERGNNLGTNVICSSNNNIIYCDDEEEIGQSVTYYEKDKEGLSKANIKVTELKVPASNWVIKSYYDEKQYDSVIIQNIIMTVIMLAVIVIVLICLVFYTSDKLVSSISIIVEAMKSVERGNFDVNIAHDKNMTMETAIIADGFSVMVKNIKSLMDNIRKVSLKQKDAEIRALEAQINPHFLYNTLDTINWKAIEKSEFEISDMINSLGKILRYSVLNSNKIVTIKEEMDWLKPYIYLQESRLKNKFELFSNIDDDLLQCCTHKLLLQPFIENAISHGLKERKEGGILIITARNLDEFIEFSIDNNGPHIEENIVEMVNNNCFTEEYLKNHIGIANVMGRLNMYYGHQSSVYMESSDDGFTRVKIKIPKIRAGRIESIGIEETKLNISRDRRRY